MATAARFGDVLRAPTASLSTFELFKQRLIVVPADTDELLDRVFRLRFQVYCVERGFEDSGQYPDGRERDADDVRSMHFLVLDRATGVAAGTVRLILPQGGGDLPVFRLIGGHSPRRSLPPHATGEISRFAVAKAYRRPVEAGWSSAAGRRTGLPIITFGLIQAIVMMSAIGGVTHIVAMMEPALMRLLRRLGIELNPVGGLVEHHGMRQPGWAAMGNLTARVKECHRELWEIATDAGQRLPPAAALSHA